MCVCVRARAPVIEQVDFIYNVKNGHKELKIKHCCLNF